MLHMIVNDEKWNALPKQYQAILNQAGAAAGAWMIEKYDSVNPAALKRLSPAARSCARSRSRSWKPATRPPRTI